MKILYSLLLLTCMIGAEAQNEYAKWYFGRNAGIDFMTVPPSAITHTTLFTYEGSAAMADGDGNLLMYTDGSTIWNAQQQVMANGTGLMGNGSTVQTALIVKQPGHTGIYFVFTLDYQGGPNGLRYSVVDMSLAAGMGSVTSKNIPVIAPCTEQLTGVRHCNGVDMWVVSHDYSSNNFYSFLVSSFGVNTTPVLSAVGPVPPTFSINSTAYGQGTIKISPSGKKLGLTFYNGQPNNEVALFDYDRATGMVSNYLSLQTGGVNSYGCEFSPDGTKFYTGYTTGNNLSQWDLCAGSNSAIVASQVSIPTPSAINQLQLAPDGKIYLAMINTQSLSVINFPNYSGTACGYAHQVLSLGTGTNGFGLPNFPGGIFRELPAFTYSTALLSCGTVSFTAPSYTVPTCAAQTDQVQGIGWIFGDPFSGAADTSTSNTPVHTYSSGGIYKVKLVLYYPCGTDTVYGNIAMNLPVISVTASPSQLCPGQTTTLQASASGQYPPFAYTWLNGPATSTFAPLHLSAGTTIYSVTVTNSLGCAGSGTVQVTYLAAPTLAAQDVTICQTAVATLTASGAVSYTWLPANNTGANYTVSPSSNFVYTVTGEHANGCTASKTVSVTLVNCTSLSVSRQQLQVSAYPGVVAHELNIESTFRIVICIYDLMGNNFRQYALEAGRSALDLHDLSPGMYLLRITGERYHGLQKFVKQE
jgi:hypothetical protein